MVIVEGYPTPAVAANLQPFAHERYLNGRTRTQGYRKNGQIRDKDGFYRRFADSFDGGLNTVNGKIIVDNGASVENANTVNGRNGRVSVGDNVTTEDLSTVNGSIAVGENTKVDGDVGAVNGSITLEKGCIVSREVSNVNGRIELTGAEVGGDIETVNGDVELADASVVKGDLVVEKPSGWGWDKDKSRKPRIVIGPGSRVEGTIELEREVELFISESAEVGGVSGVMSMDDAVRYSGDHP
jgi:hypothetical protein